MFPTIPAAPSAYNNHPSSSATPTTSAAARHRSATHPPAAKRRRTAFHGPVYAADWLNVQDMDADDDEDEDDDNSSARRYGAAFSYNASSSRRSTAPPSPLPAFNHLPLPNHSAPAHICDYSSPSHSPRPASHLSMLSDGSSIHDNDDEHYASHARRRGGLLKCRWSHSHLRDEAEDHDDDGARLDEEPVEVKPVALTADDTFGDHPTPSCAHALKRQYHALSFRLQLAVFRAKKRVNARLRSASDAGT